MNNPARPTVVPLSTVDERYLTSPAAWAAFRPTGSIFLTGADLRGPDGRIDMRPVVDVLERVSGRIPEMRRRILRPVLGLHAPAWVPDTGFRAVDHVRLVPGVLPAGDLPAALVAGFENGPMSADSSPWDVVVADLDDGRVLLVVRIHHVMGDGLFGRRVLTELVNASAAVGVGAAAAADEPFATEHGPSGRAGLLVHTVREFGRDARRSGGPVRVFRQRSFAGRLRRFAGRNLRPLRHRLRFLQGGADTLLQRRETAVMTYDLAPVRRFARENGGGIADLMAAWLGMSVGQVTSQRGPVRVLLPIAARERGSEVTGNAVRVLVTEVPAGSPDELGGRTAAVAGSVADAARENRFPTPTPGTWDGYATYLPVSPRVPRMFGGTADTIIFWPAMDPREKCAVLACSVGTRIAIGVVTGSGLSADELAAAMRRTWDEREGVAA
ncbi:hypothetical protein GIS00_18020 [Nakamurella sp. YIM 132087]|uniref:O-acyltransferase WSD1-like N-terminal domain-containing protein n=1 Tax=Nakamurella alba TaxID=2665158 RepID=A0A7K1FNU1_9ACTN|nr:wax ester/triacylglycerol synthase domain-containing protein [Nakamurella alba]MTD15835.1 hypothetical protein [Nakamurella alba]